MKMPLTERSRSGAFGVAAKGRVSACARTSGVPAARPESGAFRRGAAWGKRGAYGPCPADGCRGGGGPA